MKTRSILVYLPGQPYSLRMLFPNRLLAGVAGALLEAGHSTRIRDYGTLEFLERIRVARPAKVGAVAGEQPHFLRRLAAAWRWTEDVGQMRRQTEVFCDDVARELASFREAEFICFFVENIHALRQTVRVASHLREERPDLRLIGLGPLARLFGQSILEATDVFDGVCLGDAELTAVRLAERMHDKESWTDVPNLAVRTERGVWSTVRTRDLELASMAHPVYDPEVYPDLTNGTKLMLFTVEDSRGCSFRCHKCPQPGEGPSVVRTKSPSRVVDEIWRLRRQYGARAFRFCNAGTPAHQVSAVAHELLARGANVWYSREGHVREIDAGALAVLRASGCQAVSFQVDTGSQRLLDDYYGRDVTVTEIESVLRASRTSGLFTVARFAYPCPEDDYHTREETLRLIERGRPHAALISVPRLLPGSVWHTSARDFGFGVDTRAELSRVLRRRNMGVMPPWERSFLPSRIGVWTAAEALHENALVVQAVQARGVATSPPEDIALVARFAGYGSRENEFAGKVQRHFAGGDATALAAIVDGFNESACLGGHALSATLMGARQAAVGN